MNLLVRVMRARTNPGAYEVDRGLRFVVVRHCNVDYVYLRLSDVYAYAFNDAGYFCTCLLTAVVVHQRLNCSGYFSRGNSCYGLFRVVFLVSRGSFVGLVSLNSDSASGMSSGSVAEFG